MKKSILAVLCSMVFLGGIVCSSAEEPQLAFPGAEGGGKYTTGARGASSMEVYHVTNLKDSGPGSFADAVSKEGRIVVFDVSGTIHLKSRLELRKNNLTILGQTAPGDGITLAGSDVLLSDGTSNIIMRYLRIRPSDISGEEPDGLGGRWNHNIILDHCSVSWSVDEGLTLYAGSTEDKKQTPATNMTMQYCLGAESLRMSSHFKGAHGYGAIWGGGQSSYHHNLLAHHDSRSPRLDRELVSTDVRNNVIYNWGKTNSAYGAEPFSYHDETQMPSYVNWVANYYKYGPGTGTNLRSRIFDVSNNKDPEKEPGPYSEFYITNNYVEGSPSVTQNNWEGVNNKKKAVQRTAPVDMGGYDIPVQSAQDIYSDVLANAGATLPRRDSIDARIVADVKNGTGRIVNRIEEVGGFLALEETHRVFSIPQEWKEQNAMSAAKETDLVPSGMWKGYTWIEAYVNDWTMQQSAPTNPNILVTSPAISSLSSTISGETVDNGDWAVINEIQTLHYAAKALPVADTQITKMELYDGAKLLKTYQEAQISDDLSLSPGTHYLTSRAYNNKGESTTSPTSIVYVNATEEPGSWDYTQIGTPAAFSGKGAASFNQYTGDHTVSGSGKIGGKADSCGFLYKQITGDFVFTARIDEIPKYDNGVLCGMMLRQSLDPSAPMLMLADGWLKYGENIQTMKRSASSTNAQSGWLKDTEGKEISNTSDYNTRDKPELYRLPKYMKMERSGNTITLSVSDDGSDWTGNPRQPQSHTFPNLPESVYIGIAVDSAQGTPAKEYFTMAAFSMLTLNGECDFSDAVYQVPFTDRRYTSPPWIFSNSKVGEKDFSEGPYPADGPQKKDNGFGIVVNTAGGVASRTFEEITSGRTTLSFDYLTKGKENGDTLRIRLGSEDTAVWELLATENNSFTWVEESGALSGRTVGASTLGPVEKDTWYKLTVTIDRAAGTGLAQVKIQKYADYQKKTFSAQSTLCLPELSGALLNTLSFIWEAGGAKYISNVALRQEQKPAVLTPLEIKNVSSVITGGKLYMEALASNHTALAVPALAIIAVYGQNHGLTGVRTIPLDSISPGGQEPISGADLDPGANAKIMLWSPSYTPLSPCTSIPMNGNEFID